MAYAETTKVPLEQSIAEITPDRTPLELAMLAAWLNVRPDQVPAENRAHLNPHTMAAWKRVGEAAIAWETTRLTSETSHGRD